MGIANSIGACRGVAGADTQMAAAISSFGPALAHIQSRLTVLEKILEDVE
jgi:hypothetical protein